LAVANTVDGLERLRGKLGASLGATVSQDGTAGAGAHTKTESMNLRTTTVVGLEGSLAHGSISATVNVQLAIRATRVGMYPRPVTTEKVKVANTAEVN
jgi:hypothetical protein